jgi:NAD(P)-dependent dehydrogenase (short-subunit alcohol dehydrogenase family)
LTRGLHSTPLNKIATPEDVALQVALLASQKVSGHITGQIVRLHGGMEGELFAAMFYAGINADV